MALISKSPPHVPLCDIRFTYYPSTHPTKKHLLKRLAVLIHKRKIVLLVTPYVVGRVSTHFRVAVLVAEQLIGARTTAHSHAITLPKQTIPIRHDGANEQALLLKIANQVLSASLRMLSHHEQQNPTSFTPPWNGEWNPLFFQSPFCFLFLLKCLFLCEPILENKQRNP